MSNQTVTIQMVTKLSLAALAEKLTFLKRINRVYDNQFGLAGAKIGDTLQIRVPSHVQARSGRVMQVQDLIDYTVPLTINQQEGFDLGMTSADWALSIDEIQQRYIEPRMADLAAIIESNIMANVIPQIPTQVGDNGAMSSFGAILQATQRLNDQLAPPGSERTMLCNNSAEAQAVSAFKLFFNNQQQIGNQYEDGSMGRAGGFDWYSTSLMPSTVRGTGAGYLVNGAGQSGASLVVKTGTGTINIGDTFTIAGVNAVQAQTKADLGYLQDFTVTTAYAGGAGTLAISPAIVTTGPQQNVTAGPADGAAVTILGTSGQSLGQNVAFAKDAFTAAFIKLPLPPNKQAAVASYDGLSMRIIKDYDTVNDMFLTRADVVWGSAVLRPQLAVRVPNDPTIAPAA